MELKRKNEIREAMKARRKALTPEARRAASEIICAKLAADSDIGLRIDPLDGGSPIAVYLASPREVEVWLVPGLAFTRNGKRLGYGGGWYDRLLADIKFPLSIGIAHAFQVVDDLPSEPHDVLLSKVIAA